MLKAAFILGKENQNKIYPPSVMQRITSLCEVKLEAPTNQMEQILPELADIEVLFSGWGAPSLTADVLEAMPRLKLVLYGAGSLKPMVTGPFWQKGIPICSAWQANAVPVAEFTLAQIILCLKQAHVLPLKMRQARDKVKPDYSAGGGAFQATVSLISLGIIGKLVAKLLQSFDLNVLAYDPFVDPAEAKDLGVTLVSLEEAFARSRVVSLHTPWLPETEGMVTGDLLRRIPRNGAFINTARGAVVNETEMIEVLKERQDLTAHLDVTYPEPPVPDSPLYELSNVFLTPHIAGSQAEECGRMGSYMADELERFINGDALRYQVSEEAFRRMA
jgi:phosphoglycerate dehydrogenase-like enzyme